MSFYALIRVHPEKTTKKVSASVYLCSMHTDMLSYFRVLDNYYSMLTQTYIEKKGISIMIT